MFKHIVEQLPNSELYAVLALLFFFTFFAIIVIRTVRFDKKFIRKMERLPLESSSNGENSDG